MSGLARSASEIAGVPMFPPTSAEKARGRHDFACERRGGGLAVRSGDRDDGAGQKLRRQFNLADHRFAESTRLHQRRRIHRHAGADHDQILSAKRAVAVAAGLNRDAVIEQHRDFVAQFVAALGVGNGDPRPVRLQK